MKKIYVILVENCMKLTFVWLKGKQLPQKRGKASNSRIKSETGKLFLKQILC